MESPPVTPRLPAWWTPVAIGAAVAAVVWPLASRTLYETHDGHYAAYNAAQFDLALRDGQFPVRWLPDLFGGRGIPHFLFYHPLVFFLVSLIHLAGPGFIASLEIAYVLALAGSAAAMFAFLREILPRAAATVGAVAYVVAPFQLVEVHVKGDPPAVLAFAFAPLTLMAIGRAARGTRFAVPALAAASAGLVLSHAVSAMLLAPFLLAYAFVEMPKPAAPALARIAAGGTLGALVSAFQWLPALAERGLVHIDSPLGIRFFDYREHFLAAWQWLSPLWGYHGSFAGTRDDMSFQVGPVHAVGVALAVLAYRKLARGAPLRLAGWALATTAVALILTLPVSRPIWDALPHLQIAQFPWRFLGPVTLATAVLAAVAASIAPRRALVIAATVFPAAITAAFAAATGNRIYWAVAGFYALAGAIVAVGWRTSASKDEAAPAALAAMLVLVALPWSAVPLHARLKGEPKRVALTEADLSPERVRLGIRRTTARDDYLPRSVRTIPPRDPEQEFVPPPGAAAPPDWVVLDGTLARASAARRSFSFTLDYEAPEAARVALNLHDFPGWVSRLDDRAIPHGSDDEGRVVLELPAGAHRASLTFGKTPARRLGDRASLVGLVALGVWLGVALRRRPGGSASARPASIPR